MIKPTEWPRNRHVGYEKLWGNNVTAGPTGKRYTIICKKETGCHVSYSGDHFCRPSPNSNPARCLADHIQSRQGKKFIVGKFKYSVKTGHSKDTFDSSRNAAKNEPIPTFAQ